MKLPEKAINHSHGRCAVYIVVAINEHLLFVADRLLDTGDGLIHILHEERVVKRRQVRVEKTTCLIEGGDPSPH